MGRIADRGITDRVSADVGKSKGARVIFCISGKGMVQLIHDLKETVHEGRHRHLGGVNVDP